MIVVKVGGSLFDHPALGTGLREYAASLAPKPVLFVPGGGSLADAVRELDRTHHLGEEVSHWLALRTLGVTAELLRRLVDSLHILDPFTFAREDESRSGALPHTWSVTTDSIAARAALVLGAERLILLKSTDIPPEMPWEVAAERGWVDAHFPQIAATLPCPIVSVNFRQELDARA